MARNDLTDSRSRDQYPVDDDQDGRFDNIDSDEDAIDSDRITEFSDIPPTDGVPDSYDNYGREAYGDRAAETPAQDRAAGVDSEAFAQAHANVGREEIQSAAVDYFSRVDPDDFQASVENSVIGTPDQQLTGCASALLQELEKAGIPASRATEEAGLSSHRPEEMEKADVSSLIGYAQQAAPDALGNALADNPQLGQLLGTPVLKGILGRLNG